MRKRLLFTLIILAAAVITMAADRKFILVIDPGHGGKDVGAPGKNSYEKNINLSVALAFGKYVEKNCSDVKVIYTRKTDVFVKLEERANIANRNKADLFISIHTNALDGGKISRGLETYTLGMHRAADNLNVAKRENSVILMEKDYKQTYAGFDPKSAESYIMFELMQDKHMANSVELAKLIQSEVCASSGRVNKGVHQAGFLVIRETSMPSCLIELGFITTPDEEQFLNTQEGQDKMALGIYNAFVKYKKKYGHVNKSAQNDYGRNDNEDMLLAMSDHDARSANNMEDRSDENASERQNEQQIITDDGASSTATEYSEQREVRKMTSTEPPKATSNPPKTNPNLNLNPPKVTQNPPAQTVTTTTPVGKAIKEEPATPKNNPAASVKKTEQTTEIKKDTTPVTTKKTVPEPKTETAKPASEPKAESVKPVAEPKAEPAKPVAEPKKEPEKPKEEIPVHGPVFKVQIAATSQEIPTTSSVFQGVENIESYQENGMFKYTVGATPDFDEISNLRKDLLAKFPQAFIIAFKDGEKTELAKAIREYKNIKNKKE